MPTFADVIFPQRVSQSFTYSVPSFWLNALKVGHWVLAPFGRTARPGFVVALSEHPPAFASPDTQIRELEEQLTSPSGCAVDPVLMALAEWMADYYIAPFGVCFQLIQSPQLPFKSSSRLLITSLGIQAMERGRLSDSAKILLLALHRRPKGVALVSLKKMVATGSATLASLKRQKWVEEVRTYTIISPLEKTIPAQELWHRVQSDKAFHARTHATAPPSWWKDFQQHIARKSFGEYFTNDCGPQFCRLLVRMIRETLCYQRRVLVICPDIHQATSWARTLHTALGVRIGLFHSRLTDTARSNEWQAITQNHYPVVVGTRSSVFVPIASLGLMCVSHEADASYKHEQSPYYHVRDVARKRARLSHATFFLHAPHPSLETIYHVSTTTKLTSAFLCKTRKNVDSIHVLDHQQSFSGTTLSTVMRHGIQQSLAKGGGIVIFHNRKGFSSSLVCQDCGLAPHCVSCQVPFGFFAVPPHIRCPYCGRMESVPLVCPACAGVHLEPGGFGTERLEQELRREFPDAMVGRLDRNNVRTASSAQRIRTQFNKGTIQVLIGTEMLFHGIPLSSVRFVGIPCADAGLHFPDFRSAERLYHHLQSAIDLMTDWGSPGQVVIQTRLPSHHVMQAVATQQPSCFYDHELVFRQAVEYPPFVDFIQMTVSGKSQVFVQEAARHWVQLLASQVADSVSPQSFPLSVDTRILGPMASYALKSQRLFRESMLFKAADVDQAKIAIRRTHETLVATKRYKGLQFGINVNPMEMV